MQQRGVGLKRALRRRGALLTAVAAFASVLGAAAIALGEFPEFGGTQPGELTGFGDFTNADNCRSCHGGGFGGDSTFLPFDTWAGTMMANSARDPVFFAALAVANQDAPPSAVEHCVRCHSPSGYVRGHTLPTDGSALDATDLQGVGCDVCHRAVQTPNGNDSFLHGDAQLVFTDDQAKHGKYPDANSPAHATVVDDGPTKSDFCAQCHIVTNPGNHLRDDAGTDLGIAFPIETTFIEWQQSSFPTQGTGATCQGCHMPIKPGDHPVSSLFGEPLHSDTRQHFFVGGNHWGIRAVMEANPARATQFAVPFQNALANVLAFLPTAATVTLVSPPPATLAAGEPFDVTVRVKNNTGHKFPTGYVDGRRAWVAVEIIDAGNTSHALAGGYDSATGTIAASPPTHVYRAVHGRWDGAAGVEEHSMVKQDMLLSDTRIPPTGFAPDVRTMTSAEIDYSDGQGGYHDYDEITLSLIAPAGVTGVATLSARVYYQSISREYVDFLQSENVTDSAGDTLKAIYDATDQGPPLLVASADAAVDFGGAGAGGSGGAGAGGSGGAGTGGASPTGGAAPNGEAPEDSGGCSCRITAERNGGGGLSGVVALFVLSLCVAQRRRRTPHTRGAVAGL